MRLNLTKREIVFIILIIVALLGGGGGGYALADCPEVGDCDPTVVEIGHDPCVVEPVDITVTQDPCVCVCEIQPIPAKPCPEVKIVPTGHFLGMGAGAAQDASMLSVGYSYARPKWLFSADLGHLRPSGAHQSNYYRTWDWQPPTFPDVEGAFLYVSAKRKIGD